MKFGGIADLCSEEPELPKEGYRGLLTDVHVHSTNHDRPDDFARQLLREMNEEGVDRVVVQPNHGLGNSPRDMTNLDQLWGEISTICPRIITLLYGFDPDAADAALYVARGLASEHFGGVGELEFQHSKMDLAHDPESVGMRSIYGILEKRGQPLHFQADLPRRPALEAQLRRVATEHSRLNFLWFGNNQPEPWLDLPNVWFNVFVHMDAWRPPPGVVGKALIGSDAAPTGFWNPGTPALPYENFAEAMRQARAALTRLPITEADPLAHGNFDRLWPKH